MPRKGFLMSVRNIRLRLVFRNRIWDMGAWWREPVGKVQDIMIIPGGMG